MSLIFLRNDGYKSHTVGYLLVDVFELEFQLPLLFVPLSHHFLEVGLNLHHLVVKSSELLILFLSGVVHYALNTYQIIINYNKIYSR